MAQAKAIHATSAVRFNRFLALVYLVMAVGMAVTALVATSVSNNEELMKRILYYPWFTFGLFMLQIIVVVWLSTAVMRMSPGFAFLLFLIYSALTGLSLSAIFIYYSQTTICLYLLGDRRDVLVWQRRWIIHQRRHERGGPIFDAVSVGLVVWLAFLAFLPILSRAEPGDEFYGYHALCRAHGLGHQSPQTDRF